MCPSSKVGPLRWAVNTNTWNPTRTEWVSAMRLVGSDQERSRINRYVFKKDAKHAIVGRLLIRKCCLDFLGTDLFSNLSENQPVNGGLKMIRSEKGKPILMQIDTDGNQSVYDRFHFNISHSGDYCVLAAGNDSAKLGIDIMKIEISGGMQRINDFFRIMHRQFSLQEWDYIRFPQTDLSKLSRFIRLWSLKESLVKAEGSGIVFPLSKISFTCQTELTSPQPSIINDSTVTLNGQSMSEWQFEESMIDRMHYVSVAKTVSILDNSSREVSDSTFQFKLLTIEDLFTDSNLGPLFTYDDEKYWTDFCTKS